MIESSLPYVSHKTAPFRAPVLCGNRSSGVQPISVNRQPCSCLMQWSDRELTAFGMSHRTAPPEPLFYVRTGAQPLSVNRQPCLSVNLDCSQQLIQNCIRAWSFLNDLMIQHQKHCVFSSDLNVLTASAVILVLIIGTLVRSCRSIVLILSR